MSTKIFDAYHVRDSSKVWEVLKDIRQRGRKQVVDRLRAFYFERMDELDTGSEKYKAARAKDRQSSESWVRANLVQEMVRDGFKKNATSMQRDTFDPDVSVTLMQHPTGFYLRAFCDRVSLLGGSLDFLREHPELEDFHYQNQTDPPKGFTDEAWTERGRIWDEMASNGGFFEDQLILEISSWGLFWRLDPWLDIVRELHETPREFPIREEVLARQLRGYKAFTEVTAERGLIRAMMQEGSIITIQKARKRSQKGQWITKVATATKVHRNLERAVDHVQYLFCEPAVRRMADRWQKEALEKKKARRAHRRGTAA